MKTLIKNFYSNNFVFKSNEKLSKLSILSIIILNIFVLMTLYQGITFQTQVINTPENKYPYNCRDVLNNSSSYSDFNNYFYTSYNYDTKYQNIVDLEVDERCTQISEKIDLIKKEIDIESYKKRSDELYYKESDLSNQMYSLKSNYDTVLFEKMSNQDSKKSLVEGDVSAENIKEKYDNLNKEIEKIKQDKQKLQDEFKNLKQIQNFVSFIETNKNQILKDIANEEKFYYVKKELIVLAFLIPLLALFFYLMKKNLLKEKYILYVIFKNIMFITAIPTFISLFSLINIFIPKIFVEKLLMFFYSLEIPFVVYYLVIAIFIAIFIFIIVRLQKKFKEENEKLKNNSISKIEAFNKNLCVVCKNRVDYFKMSFCPCCKNELSTTCLKCGEKTTKGLNNCYKCGENLI